MSGESILDAVQDTEAFVAANDDFVMVVFRGSHELTVRCGAVRRDCSCGPQMSCPVLSCWGTRRCIPDYEAKRGLTQLAKRLIMFTPLDQSIPLRRSSSTSCCTLAPDLN